MDSSGMTVRKDTTPDDEINIVFPTNVEESGLEELAKTRNDPFARSIEKIRDLDGLNPNFKRKVTRRMNKMAGETGSEAPLATGHDNAKSKARTDNFATGYGAFDVVEPPYNFDYLAKLYEVSPAHMAAVDAKVTNIVGLGYSFTEASSLQERLSNMEDEEKLARARRRASRAKIMLEEWLDESNSEITFLEVLRNVMTDLETTGNGYIEVGRISRGPNKGMIGYLGHIHSTTIRRRVQKDGYVQLIAGRAKFFRNFRDTKTTDPIGTDSNPNEIIHLTKYTPTNSYYGMPDVVAAKNAVAGEEFSARFNLDYFEHKAVPRYIVILKNARLSKDAEQKLVNFLQMQLKGQHHRTVYIPLPADSEGRQVEFKLEPIEAKVTDASFTKYREMNRDDILMAHRVPAPQVGFTEAISLGASKESTRMFKEQVCRPWQDIIERRLRPVFREKTDMFDFHLTELTLTDEETASRVHERYLRWEVNTPNEIRDWLGIKGREGGDKTVGVMAQANARNTMGSEGQKANQTRTRDSERSGGPDAASSDRSRNSAGEGRAVE
ncbi:MAG: phage portal protein [Actinobacteria bacterium]|nr:phage portal protein [Actinomycetota bacterium]